VKVHHSIHNFKELDITSVLTIGTFDGVHIGHQKIIHQLNQIKTDKNNCSAVLTFFPHPRIVLNYGDDFKMLTTIEEKIQLLDKFGLDHLIIEPFTKEFSKLTALYFVRDILVNKLHLNKLVIGYDHQFGKNREGDFDQLKEYGALYQFSVEKIPAQEIKNIAVSSTKIREAIEKGNIEKANSYLGYSYLLTGKIVKGKGVGRKINYPTINLFVEEDYKLIPKTGVYIVKTKVENRMVFGIMNIGFRPTLDGKHQTIEIHLLDFNGDLYGKKIQIKVLKRLREERKFDSIESLTEQIQKDEKIARLWINRLLQNHENS
jgi:riboflavin kinase/FMN adenylyltransferase